MGAVGTWLKQAIGLYPATPMVAAVQQMFAGIKPGAVADPPVRGVREHLAAYSTQPWLRAVVGRIADSVASTEWRLYVATTGPGTRAVVDEALVRAKGARRKALIDARRGEGRLREIEDHLLLDAFRGGNSFLTGHQTLTVMQDHLELVGESFLLKERNALGAPIAFWPIPPDWILALPTPAFRFYRISSRGWQALIPDTEILWIAQPNPLNPYGRGTGISQALGDEIATDEQAAKTTLSWFSNRARPDVLITADGLRESEVRRLEEDWHNRNQGFWRAFKTHFLNRQVQVHEFDQDFRGQQFVQIRQHERDTIMQAWGLPPEVLGVLDNSNRATIESADYLFQSKVVEPRLHFLRDVFQERIIPEYDPRLILDFESPVQEDREYRLRAAQAFAPALRVDEQRALAGFAPLEGGEGRGYITPLNLSGTETPGGAPALPEPDLDEEPSPALRRLNRAMYEIAARTTR